MKIKKYFKKEINEVKKLYKQKFTKNNRIIICIKFIPIKNNNKKRTILVTIFIKFSYTRNEYILGERDSYENNSISYLDLLQFKNNIIIILENNNIKKINTLDNNLYKLFEISKLINKYIRHIKFNEDNELYEEIDINVA